MCALKGGNRHLLLETLEMLKVLIHVLSMYWRFTVALVWLIIHRIIVIGTNLRTARATSKEQCSSVNSLFYSDLLFSQ